MTIQGAGIAVPMCALADPYVPALTLLPLKTLPECANSKKREKRVSYKGYMHCELHPYYQVVFPNWGCNCHTGECRPTVFEQVAISEQYPEGIKIKVDGEWFPVPKGTLHQDRKIPEPLLEYEAHVCCLAAPPKPQITCAWINLLG